MAGKLTQAAQIFVEGRRRNRELERERQSEQDARSLVPALLENLGIDVSPDPARDLPFNEATFFDDEPVSRGTGIADVIEDTGVAPDLSQGERRLTPRTGRTVVSPKQREALINLFSRNPEKVPGMLISAIESANTQQIAQAKRQNDEMTKDAIFLDESKNPLDMVARIRQIANEPGVTDERRNELKRILATPSFEARKLIIRKNILDGRDQKVIFTEQETRRKEEAKSVEAQRAEEEKSLESQKARVAKSLEAQRAEKVKSIEAQRAEAAKSVEAQRVEKVEAPGDIKANIHTLPDGSKISNSQLVSQYKLDNNLLDEIDIKILSSSNPEQADIERQRIRDALPFNEWAKQKFGIDVRGGFEAAEPRTVLEDPIDLPATKNELVVGTRYNTKRGLAVWNGKMFEPVSGE